MFMGLTYHLGSWKRAQFFPNRRGGYI